MEETLYGGVPPGRKTTKKQTIGVQGQQATKKTAAPPLQTRAPQPSQSLSMADMLGALEEYAAPRAAPQGQAAAMEVEGTRSLPARAARGRATLAKPADAKANKIIKAIQKEQEEKQKDLYIITMARKEGMPVETFKSLQMMNGRIKYATEQADAQKQIVQSLEQKLEQARALLEEKEEEVVKQTALSQYVLMKGKEGKVITTQEILNKGMDVMEGGKKKTQRRR